MEKQGYNTPEFEELGSVADLTQAVGMSTTTDAAFTGSMFTSHPGMGMGMMGPRA